MAKMNLTSLDVLIDEVFGKRGTPKRDAMEKRLQEEDEELSRNSKSTNHGKIIPQITEKFSHKSRN